MPPSPRATIHEFLVLGVALEGKSLGAVEFNRSADLDVVLLVHALLDCVLGLLGLCRCVSLNHLTNKRNKHSIPAIPHRQPLRSRALFTRTK